MRPLTNKELKDQIESFNNACVTSIEDGWMYFLATNFAAEGIRRELGKRVEALVGNEPSYNRNYNKYRILIAYNQ